MRKSMLVYSSVKNIVQDLKKQLGLKNEGEVIAYLHAFYSRRYRTLTLEEHKELLKEVEQITRQQEI